MQLVQLLKDKFGVSVLVQDEYLEILNPNAEALWLPMINSILISSTLANDIGTIGHEFIHVVQELRSDLFGVITDKMYEVLGYSEVSRIRGLVSEYYSESRLNLEMQSYCWEKWYQIDSDAALNWLVNLV